MLEAFAEHSKHPSDPKAGALIQVYVWPCAKRVAPYQTQLEELISLNPAEHH